MLIYFRSINKHGRQRQFLFLIGWYLENLLWNRLAKWIETWYEASLEGPLKIAHLVPICLQTWPPQTILVCDWLISKKSSPLKPLCQMNRNLVGSILGRSSYKDCSFSTDPIANMAAGQWQTWSHNVFIEYTSSEGNLNSTLVVIGTECIDSCRSNYHNITTMTALPLFNIFQVTANFNLNKCNFVLMINY